MSKNIHKNDCRLKYLKYKKYDGDTYAHQVVAFVNKDTIRIAIESWETNRPLCIDTCADLSYWNVSEITDMSELFKDLLGFNTDISRWNVSNVTNMSHMFNDARSFNQPLDNWNVYNVTDMEYMFFSAESFNQPLNTRNVSNVF